MKPTPEQIAKLPKWAVEHIRELQRDRDISVRDMHAWLDNQTPSPFRKSELLCTQSPPVHSVVYFQARISMEVEHAGVELRIVLRDKHIDLQWCKAGQMSGDICCRPASHQSIDLLTKENMR